MHVALVSLSPQISCFRHVIIADVNVKYKNNGIVMFFSDIKLTPKLRENLSQVLTILK
jgi:hypothetical protein